MSDALLSKIVLSRLFGSALGTEVGARLWEGSTVRAPQARFELIVRTPFALRAAFPPPPELRELLRAIGSMLGFFAGQARSARSDPAAEDRSVTAAEVLDVLAS